MATVVDEGDKAVALRESVADLIVSGVLHALEAGHAKCIDSSPVDQHHHDIQ